MTTEALILDVQLQQKLGINHVITILQVLNFLGEEYAICGDGCFFDFRMNNYIYGKDLKEMVKWNLDSPFLQAQNEDVIHFLSGKIK